MAKIQYCLQTNICERPFHFLINVFLCLQNCSYTRLHFFFALVNHPPQHTLSGENHAEVLVIELPPNIFVGIFGLASAVTHQRLS